MKYKTIEEAYEKAIIPHMLEMKAKPRKYYNKEFIAKKSEEIEEKLDNMITRYESLTSLSETSPKLEKSVLNTRLSILLLERKQIHLQGQLKMLKNEERLNDVRDKLNKIRAKIKQNSIA